MRTPKAKLVRGPRLNRIAAGAHGAPAPIAPTPTLARLGSLYITRPVLEHYLLTEEERERRARETFGWVLEGQLRGRVARKFEGLEEAARAHEYLESRSARGKVLIGLDR